MRHLTLQRKQGVWCTELQHFTSWQHYKVNISSALSKGGKHQIYSLQHTLLTYGGSPVANFHYVMTLNDLFCVDGPLSSYQTNYNKYLTTWHERWQKNRSAVILPGDCSDFYHLAYWVFKLLCVMSELICLKNIYRGLRLYPIWCSISSIPSSCLAGIYTHTTTIIRNISHRYP